MLAELLDRDAAVLEHARLAVDEGDRAPARGGVRVRRVVGHEAEVVLVDLHLAEVHRLHRAVGDRDLEGLAGAVVGDRQRVFSHVAPPLLRGHTDGCVRLALLGHRMAVALPAAGPRTATRTARFDEDGFDITFEYPEEMNEADNVQDRIRRRQLGEGDRGDRLRREGQQGRDHRAALRPQPGRSTPENLERAKAELDPLVAQISPGAPRGETGEIRGFPSIDYRGLDGADRSTAPETRLVALFDGDVEYLVNCQSHAQAPGRHREGVRPGARHGREEVGATSSSSRRRASATAGRRRAA